MSGLLQFSISEIKEKGQARFSGEIPSEDFTEGLAGSAELVSPLSVELELSARSGKIWLRGSVSGRWSLPCCRCLAWGAAGYDAALDESFPLSASTIDAVEEVRQALILAVPMRHYCKPDCKGLCPRCGGNKNDSECGCVTTQTS